MQIPFFLDLIMSKNLIRQFLSHEKETEGIVGIKNKRNCVQWDKLSSCLPRCSENCVGMGAAILPRGNFPTPISIKIPAEGESHALLWDSPAGKSSLAPPGCGNFRSPWAPLVCGMGFGVANKYFTPQTCQTSSLCYCGS